MKKNISYRDQLVELSKLYKIDEIKNYIRSKKNLTVSQVELRGSCSGCPSSLMTLKQGVQNLLCHYVKEVKSVEAI